MFNVGGPEVLVILLVALIVLGPQQLPKAVRSVGNVMSELRRMSSGFQDEIRSAMDVSTETDARREGAKLARRPEEADITETVAWNTEDEDDDAGAGNMPKLTKTHRHRTAPTLRPNAPTHRQSEPSRVTGCRATVRRADAAPDPALYHLTHEH